MKEHTTHHRCPSCGRPASLTTEWGWIDDSTCTAKLFCPDCQTIPSRSLASVSCVHLDRRDDRTKEETENRAAEIVSRVGFIEYPWLEHARATKSRHVAKPEEPAPMKTEDIKRAIELLQQARHTLSIIDPEDPQDTTLGTHLASELIKHALLRLGEKE